MRKGARLLLPIVQGAIAVAVAAAGHWRVGLFLGGFALLLLLTGRLGKVDKGSPEYLRVVRWAFRVIGLAFFVLGTLQVTGTIAYDLAVAVPLSFLAGAAFIWSAQYAYPDRVAAARRRRG
jgi:hypothetical protein